MTALHTSFVLGYHGCSEKVGRSLILRQQQPIKSETAYDWLGPGFYLWESDPQRAYEWAEQKKKRDPTFKPFVVGVVLDLGNCLDLTNREDLALLQVAYDGLKATLDVQGTPLPENRDASFDSNNDKLFRNLDCAVIRYLHASLDTGSPLPAAYDTVRGLFQEGAPLYPGSGFRSKTHTQIAVCNLDCIKGFFIPPL
ncbi:hypothetical protein AGA_1P96 (plasmid) [Acetobacter ghanensis]|uniref:DUF3990 domain-containing protein n=1 Tax=Acetobacter ghanensis TaxID=431306 RepID=A0A0U5BN82_9PROT|nr:hypothetical protein [Acetobacter ghanensis]NHO40564.1 hypothetical protein [Acetobacter ghanensis]CEF57403.1 hypothetical protein AGA_1P96 [Acetobacter ghanensis]